MACFELELIREIGFKIQAPFNLATTHMTGHYSATSTNNSTISPDKNFHLEINRILIMIVSIF